MEHIKIYLCVNCEQDEAEGDAGCDTARDQDSIHIIKGGNCANKDALAHGVQPEREVLEECSVTDGEH